MLEQASHDSESANLGWEVQKPGKQGAHRELAGGEERCGDSAASSQLDAIQPEWLPDLGYGACHAGRPALRCVQFR